MIRPDKHDCALDAIHMLLVYARRMAASHAAYDQLVAVLDVAEYLPMLFLRKEDMTDHLHDTLREFAGKYPGFQAALERFEKS